MLRVKNINSRASENVLWNIFKKFGEPTAIHKFEDAGAKSTAYGKKTAAAFVVFGEQSEADSAKKHFNNKTGYRFQVDYATADEVAALVGNGLPPTFPAVTLQRRRNEARHDSSTTSNHQAPPRQPIQAQQQRGKSLQPPQPTQPAQRGIFHNNHSVQQSHQHGVQDRGQYLEPEIQQLYAHPPARVHPLQPSSSSSSTLLYNGSAGGINMAHTHPSFAAANNRGAVHLRDVSRPLPLASRNGVGAHHQLDNVTLSDKSYHNYDPTTLDGFGECSHYPLSYGEDCLQRNYYGVVAGVSGAPNAVVHQNGQRLDRRDCSQSTCRYASVLPDLCTEAEPETRTQHRKQQLEHQQHACQLPYKKNKPVLAVASSAATLCPASNSTISATRSVTQHQQQQQRLSPALLPHQPPLPNVGPTRQVVTPQRVATAEATNGSSGSHEAVSAVDADTFEIPNAQLAAEIVKRVEHYFSDAYILNDPFCHYYACRDRDGFIPLQLIASFERVKQVAKDWRVVAHACQILSKEVEFSKDGTMVRRVTFLPETDETSPSRTVVAIGLAVADASIARVAEMFDGVGRHGAIALIRILRPGHTLPPDVRQCAARHQDILTSICAVVEFEQVASARVALEESSALMPAGVKLVALFSRLNGSNGPEPPVPEVIPAEPEPSTSTGITRTDRAEKLRQLVQPIYPLGRGNRLDKSLAATGQEVRRNVAVPNRGAQPAPMAGPAANRVGKQSTVPPAPKYKSIRDGNPLEGARVVAAQATVRPAVGTAAGKPYKCTECSKRFTTSWHRKRHVMYRHTKEKPFQCPNCDYDCVERNKLKRHRLYCHTKVKPFKCPKCDYDCVERSRMKRHFNSMHKRKVKTPLLRTPKTTCCRVCQQRFPSPSQLEIHVQDRHSEEKLHSCPFCQYECVKVSSLKSHLMSHMEID